MIAAMQPEIADRIEFARVSESSSEGVAPLAG
jgi:hypothetical protein